MKNKTFNTPPYTTGGTVTTITTDDSISNVYYPPSWNLDENSLIDELCDLLIRDIISLKEWKNLYPMLKSSDQELVNMANELIKNKYKESLNEL